MKTSNFNNGLIWFGAAVSIAEIITGTEFASLGFKNGLLAIILGHLIGGLLLFFTGYIGGISQKSSMETTKISYGVIGSKFFAVMNIIQLVGWTGIMIYDGSLALNKILNLPMWIWCSIIGLLIILWIFIGITNLGKINTIAMTALFILTIIMSKLIFSSNVINSQIAEQTLSFGSAMELAIAMPLSWLPLISDYTKDAQKPLSATIISAVTYTITSCWMYFVGMGIALFTQEKDLSLILVKAGFGICGLIILILSTVTTTFLDAFSAGISSQTVLPKVKGKYIAIIVTVIGIICAILLPMDNITGFLYFIGSVFAPMIAVILADYFVLKTDNSEKKISISKIIIWFVGFILYRILMNYDLILGSTIPSILFTFALCIIVEKIRRIKSK